MVKIDTSADINPMSKSTFDSLPNQHKIRPSRIALFSPRGKLKFAGQFITIVTYCNKNYDVDTIVISGEHVNNLLGRQAAHEMGLVARLEKVKTE